MNIALKEWAVVIEALARRRQHFLLRKGGIAEGRRGFELKHREFLLFPTWEHQQADSLKPEFRSLFEQTRPRRPGVVAIEYLARVSQVLQAPADREAMGEISDRHIWADSYVRMRYDYRPERPLFILVLRIYRLPAVAKLADDPVYAGCRSWLTLREEVDSHEATPIETDEQFAESVNSLIKKLPN